MVVAVPTRLTTRTAKTTPVGSKPSSKSRL
jgi:hypothetical protein